MRQRLHENQIGLFAGQLTADVAEQLFIFPDELERLKEPLRSYVTGLFQPSAYQESAFLRGIYFCGAEVDEPSRRAAARPLDEASPDGVADDVGARLEELTERTYFVRDLLEQKVFPEATLATATAGTVLARNRRVRTAQILLVASTLVLTLGLWRAHRQLDLRKPELEFFLEQIYTDVRATRAGASGVGADRADRVLELMADTNLSWFGSVFIPSSWFSSFNENVKRSIVREFDWVVLPVMESLLEATAESLIDGSGDLARGSRLRPAAGGAGTSTVVSIDQMREFQSLEGLVYGLVELHENVALYNNLPESPRLEDFASVVDYLFDARLSQSFSRHSTLYRRALREVHQLHEFPANGYQESSRRRVLELARRLYRALENNSLSRVLDDLRLEVQRFNIQPAQTSGVPTSSLEELLAALERADAIVRRPELGWLFGVSFDLGSEFDRLLLGMESSSFLAGTSDAVAIEGEERVARLQGTLLVKGSPYLGPFLERTEDLPTRPGVLVLQGACRLLSPLL